MTYLRLVHTLNIKLPLIDPAHYIHRFAALLEFGDETGKVATDAVRLVQRFNRDWMTAGRRPAGICGACILLAARMNNFRRSIQEVVQVVKIADVTLKKRLQEFKLTSSGDLTVADFRKVWLEEEMDPPAFTKGKEKEKGKLKVTVSKKKKKKKKRKRGESSESSEESSEDAEGDDASCTPGPSNVPAVDSSVFTQGILAGTMDASEESSTQLFLPDPDDDQVQGDTEDNQGDGDKEGDDKYNYKCDDETGLYSGHRDDNSAIDPRLLDLPRPEPEPPGTRIPSQMLPPMSPLDETFDSFLTEEVSEFIESTQGSLLTDALDTVDRRRQSSAPLVDELIGLDEEELDRMILNEDEVKVKERIWVELNREYLENLAGKYTNHTSLSETFYNSNAEAKAIREQNGESSNSKTRKVRLLLHAGVIPSLTT
jgi:transcription factor IIIB 90 kDa subunit